MMRALAYEGSIVVLAVDVEHDVMGLAGQATSCCSNVAKTRDVSKIRGVLKREMYPNLVC